MLWFGIARRPPASAMLKALRAGQHKVFNELNKKITLLTSIKRSKSVIRCGGKSLPDRSTSFSNREDLMSELAETASSAQLEGIISLVRILSINVLMLQGLDSKKYVINYVLRTFCVCR